MSTFIIRQLRLCFLFVTVTRQQAWNPFYPYEYQVNTNQSSYTLDGSISLCGTKTGVPLIGRNVSFAAVLSIHNTSEEVFIAGLVRNRTTSVQGVWLGLDYKNNGSDCHLNWSWRDGSTFGTYESGRITCDSDSRYVRLVVYQNASIVWQAQADNLTTQWAICKRAIPCASNPCQNNGVCNYNQLYDYTCSCTSGYSGTHCEAGSSTTVTPKTISSPSTTSTSPTTNSSSPSTTPPLSATSNTTIPDDNSKSVTIGLAVAVAVAAGVVVILAVADVYLWRKLKNDARAYKSEAAPRKNSQKATNKSEKNKTKSGKKRTNKDTRSRKRKEYTNERFSTGSGGNDSSKLDGRPLPLAELLPTQSSDSSPGTQPVMSSASTAHQDEILMGVSDGNHQLTMSKIPKAKKAKPATPESKPTADAITTTPPLKEAKKSGSRARRPKTKAAPPPPPPDPTTALYAEVKKPPKANTMEGVTSPGSAEYAEIKSTTSLGRNNLLKTNEMKVFNDGDDEIEPEAPAVPQPGMRHLPTPLPKPKLTPTNSC